LKVIPHLEEEVDVKDSKAHHENGKVNPTPQKPKVSKEDESLSPFSDEDDPKPAGKYKF
jgi:hypothetical protein